ncbi:MAG: hypothetical protein RLZZ78_1656 [Armatimonadota bacterium]
MHATLSPVVGRTPNVPASIRMYPAGDAIYVAFCDYAVLPQYLELAGMLYVFMQDGLDYAGVVDAIAAVLNRLPADSALHGIHIDALIQHEWISQFVTDDLDAPLLHQGQSLSVRRHI